MKEKKDIINYSMNDGQEAFAEKQNDADGNFMGYIRGMYHNMEPLDDKTEELESQREELDSMFEDEATSSLNEGFTEINYPQYIKTPENDNLNNGGYSDLTSIVIATIVLSLVAVIVSSVIIIGI